MRFSVKNLTALAAILTYSRKVVLASDDEMAAVCYDEDELAQLLPPGIMFDPCGFKPQNSDARKCCKDPSMCHSEKVPLTVLQCPWITSSTTTTTPV